MTRLDQARRGGLVQVGTERHNDYVGFVGVSVRHHTFGDRVDGEDLLLQEAHTGLGDVPVVHANRFGLLLAEHHIEFREAK